MSRYRALLLLLPLLLLPGCFGMLTPTTATLTGTVRIDASPDKNGASIASTSLSSLFFSMPAGSRVTSSPARIVQSQRRDPGPVEVLLYGSHSPDEARSLAERAGFTYVRGSRDDYHVLRDRLGRSEERAIAAIRSAAPGARVEPNRPMYPLAIPNDPRFGEQWALEQINIVAAWDVVPPNHEPVIVAVIDTGIEFNHPDLNNEALWVDGWDFSQLGDPSYRGDGEKYGFNNRVPLAQNEDHGTMVAGVIGAITNNKIEIAGTVGDANVKLMPVRVFWMQKGELTTSEEVVARAVRFAVDNGAQVINLSLGSNLNCSANSCQPPADPLKKALDYAYSEQVVVVAAAGNDGGPVISPANYHTTIAVGASTFSKNAAPYSGKGPEIEVVAPGGSADPGPGNCGGSVISLGLDGKHTCATGTSLATPHVSGVLALMIASGVASHPDDLLQILQITAEDVGAPGRDDETGFGLVNAYGAVTAGVPEIFAGSEDGDTLSVAGTPVRSELGGVFRLEGVPEGTWTLYAWVDANKSSTVDDGDYFARHENVVVVKGRTVMGLNLVLTPYEGNELTVSR